MYEKLTQVIVIGYKVSTSYFIVSISLKPISKFSPQFETLMNDTNYLLKHGPKNCKDCVVFRKLCATSFLCYVFTFMAR